MNRRRAVLFGAAALGAYVVVAVATAALSGRRVLPLFEGIGPPPAYQWVNPPRPFASGNTKPKPGTDDIAFSGGKSVQASAVTPDVQFSVNFPVGGFDAHGNDTTVNVAITPLDPAALGPVPPGLAADGNAYRVQLTYRPSNTPADTLATPGDVFVTAPYPAQVLLYSSDGRSWSQLASHTVGVTSTVASIFTAPGWYLVGAKPNAVVSGQHRNGLGTAVTAVLVAGLAILLAVTPVAVRAVRRRTQRRNAPAPPRRPPPGPPKPGRRR